MKTYISKKKSTGLFFVLLLILLDQITKKAAAGCLKGTAGIPLIPGVLQLHYLENQSAAFSMDPVSLIQKLFHFSYFENNPQAFLSVKMGFLTILTLVVMAGLLVVYIRMPESRRFLYLRLIFLFFLAGAAGNLIDRLTNSYVIDFIYFSLIDFPVFNVADIYVTCAAFALIIVIFFYYKDEDFEVLFPTHKKEN